MRSSTVRLAFAAALTLLPLGFPAAAADGELDPSFWSDGKVALPTASDSTFGGLATQANGAMAVGYFLGVGSPSREFAYWRSVTASTWGTPCRVLPGPTPPELETDDRVLDLAFDSSGRLLVLVQRLQLDGMLAGNFVLAYEFPYCRLDLDFGTDGVVSLPGFDFAGLSGASRLAPMGNGRILIAGWNHTLGPDDTYQWSQVVRLEPDGDYDPTFSGEGCAAGPEDSFGMDVALATNGHVVMIAENGGGDFVLQDFAPDGTFLAETVVAFDFGGSNHDEASAVAATPDGRIVVVGTAAGNGSAAFEWAAMAVLSWDAQGELTLDPSFSIDGKLGFRFGTRNYNSLSDVVVQGASRVLVAGTSRTPSVDNAMAVARISLDGSFDGTFYPSGNGRRMVDFDVAAPENDLANRLALQVGRIVLGGQVDIAGDITSVGLARLTNQWIFAGGFEALEVGDWPFVSP
jgi:uncharacterized delta-60 repeat protein